MRYLVPFALLLTAACAAPRNIGPGDSGTVSTLQDTQTALKVPTDPPKYGGSTPS